MSIPFKRIPGSLLDDLLLSSGSGKTSLIMALLGEMHFAPTHPDSMFRLPRTGGVAFAVQESWVLNQTIRDNILFGSAYDEERYKKGAFNLPANHICDEWLISPDI